MVGLGLRFFSSTCGPCGKVPKSKSSVFTTSSSRVNSISPLFESGKIYAPMHEHFAQEVVEECAAFPHGDHDDYVDSTTQALMRIRQGGLLPHPEDEKEEPREPRQLEYY